MLQVGHYTRCFGMNLPPLKQEEINTRLTAKKLELLPGKTKGSASTQATRLILAIIEYVRHRRPIGSYPYKDFWGGLERFEGSSWKLSRKRADFGNQNCLCPQPLPPSPFHDCRRPHRLQCRRVKLKQLPSSEKRFLSFHVFFRCATGLIIE
jgi:hypothetical protein